LNKGSITKVSGSYTGLLYRGRLDYCIV